MEPLEAVSRFMDLSEGALPEFGVVMLAYVTPEGQQGFTYATLGNPNSMQATGLMTIVKDDMLKKFQADGL